MTNIAAPVRHQPIRAIQEQADSFTNGHTWTLNPLAAGIAPPVPYTKWRRVRLTTEWSGCTFGLVQATHQIVLALNYNKHDGSGSYHHSSSSPNTLMNLTDHAGSGALEIFAQCQAGDAVSGGWWHGFVTGYYTVGGGVNPNDMSGDYFDIHGRFAFQGPDFSIGSLAGETGRSTLRAIWDWPEV